MRITIAKAILILLAGLVFSTPTLFRAQAQNSTESGAYKVGAGVSPPRVIHQRDPEYSEQARKVHHQGTCTLMLVVEKDGTPSHIRVANPLGMGLDEKAIEAVRQWRFKPAMKDGMAISVEIAVEVEFHLYSPNDQKNYELRQKANGGDAKAQLDLANIYFKGEDVEKDERSGQTYLEKAATQGLPRAQFQMGERLAAGDSQNYAKAYMWLTLAERGGEKHSNKALKQLAAKMTSEQLQVGQSLVANWTPAIAK